MRGRRDHYLGVAAARLGVPESKLTVADGQILAPDGRSTSYWELADDALDRAASGEYQPKPTSLPRCRHERAGLDLPDKLTGRPRFVHDLPPDLLFYFGSPSPVPRRDAHRSRTAATLALPGVLTVVRDGSFLGVVAEEEEVALGARHCAPMPAGSGTRPARPGQPAGFLRSAAAETTVLAERGARPAREKVAASAEATYARPYLAHASMGLSSATALFGGGKGSRLQVWSHTQGIYLLRAELARASGLADDDVTVTHVEGPGCYGHNGADDAAMDAALLAMAVPGRPSRWSGAGPTNDLCAVRRGGRGARRRRRRRGRERAVLAARKMATGTRPGPARPGQSRCSQTVTAPAARRSKPPRNRRWRAAAAPPQFRA